MTEYGIREATAREMLEAWARSGPRRAVEFDGAQAMTLAVEYGETSVMIGMAEKLCDRLDLGGAEIWEMDPELESFNACTECGHEESTGNNPLILCEVCNAPQYCSCERWVPCADGCTLVCRDCQFEDQHER